MDNETFGTIYEAIPKFYHSPGFKRIMMEAMENLIVSFYDDNKRTIASPMEFIFYFYWNVYNIACPNGYAIEYQKHIRVDGKSYYADFFIYSEKNPENGLIVEIDGKEYHKRTKEQDKKRDKDLQKAGYKVFRYTGSSVWNNPRDIMIGISNELYLIDNNQKKLIYGHG